MKRRIILKALILLTLIFCNLIIENVRAERIEVHGELKMTQKYMDENKLVHHNFSGILGAGSSPSLLLPLSLIDTLRNLASDYKLAKQLCACPVLPSFIIQQLLENGYTEEDLLGAGVSYIDISKAQFTCGDTLVDNRDGKMYSTIRIGGQCWMGENLNIGTMVNGVSEQMDNSIIEKYCYGDNTANCTTYGALYQWNEMMQYSTIESTQGICPSGWHLPSDDEYKTLEVQLGMTQAGADATGSRGSDQGSKLAGNESLWQDGTLDQSAVFGTSGFAALPGGVRTENGQFFTLSAFAIFWSSKETGENSWIRNISSNETKVYRNNEDKSIGHSVRCVQN